jgi:hypothetical protein
MWNFSSRRIKAGRVCLACALFMGLGVSSVRAGEVLGIRVETIEIRPEAIDMRVSAGETKASPARPFIHENRLDDLDVYALSPAAIHLRLPLVTKSVVTVFQQQEGIASAWRLSGWADFIDNAAREFDVDPALIAAVIQTESAFQSRAISGKGAQGLMQIMPATGREMGLINPFDPAENIRAGTRYLKAQLTNFATFEEALAAYNAGPGNVLKYGGIPPFAETKDFVRRVAEHWQAARFPAEEQAAPFRVRR